MGSTSKTRQVRVRNRVRVWTVRTAAGLSVLGLAAAAVGAEVAPRVLAGQSLWVNPNWNPAAKQAATWNGRRASDAALMKLIAEQPQSSWFNGWTRDVRGEAQRTTVAASRAGQVPVLVAYNIPNRDCGSYSAGGERDANAYRKWIRELAAGIGDRAAVVILEPDAVASTSCLSERQRDERNGLLRDAVTVLKRGRGTLVYLDGGHARWHSAQEAAARLRAAGVENADGFALNVSNFVSTAENTKYGAAVSALVGGKRFVIDTSRNGNGPAAGNEWCNPSGRALGEAPTTRTGHALVDAYLWVKRPGESDGTCNGGPKSGAWWPEYALGLAQRSQTLLASR